MTIPKSYSLEHIDRPFVGRFKENFRTADDLSISGEHIEIPRLVRERLEMNLKLLTTKPQR